MKPEEAIERLKTIFAFGISNCIADKIARDTTFAALEKQIVKKPIMGEFGVYVCSDCECVVEEENDYGRWEDRFCPDCGQAQDWSVRE